MHATKIEFLKSIRPYVKIIAGQIASSLGDSPFQLYDVIFSAVKPVINWFRSLGIEAYYQPLAFESTLLERLPNLSYRNRSIDCSFAGGLYSEVHLDRQKLLEKIAGELPISFWGYGTEGLPRDSKILKRYHGEAWGNDMFQVLLNSKITVNAHGLINVKTGSGNIGWNEPLDNNDPDSCIKNHAINMRLYEATGAGALLITDYKDNLNDLFEVGKEVVAYRSHEECVELIKYYLQNPAEAEAIALAGQQRTLKDHTYKLRLEAVADIFERKLKNKKLKEVLHSLNLDKNALGYSETQKSEITPNLTDAWKNSSIPLKQRSQVQTELEEMYSGKINPVFQRLARTVKSITHKNDNILETGCASGYNFEILQYLLNRKIRYTGVDFSKDMITLAKELYPKVKFLAVDGAKLNFAEGEFNLVISGNMLLGASNYVEHIKEMCRVSSRYVLAHQILLHKLTPTQAMRESAYGVATVEFSFNEDEIINLFKNEGFRLVSSDTYNAKPETDSYNSNMLFERQNI